MLTLGRREYLEIARAVGDIRDRDNALRFLSSYFMHRDPEFSYVEFFDAAQIRD